MLKYFERIIALLPDIATPVKTQFDRISWAWAPDEEMRSGLTVKGLAVLAATVFVAWLICAALI